MAPEVIKQAGYGRKADIWSLGCTVIEMLTADHPWKGYAPMPACFAIVDSSKLPEMPKELSDNCRRFILACLNRNPDARPSAEECLQHAWLAEESS